MKKKKEKEGEKIQDEAEIIEEKQILEERKSSNDIKLKIKKGIIKEGNITEKIIEREGKENNIKEILVSEQEYSPKNGDKNKDKNESTQEDNVQKSKIVLRGKNKKQKGLNLQEDEKDGHGQLLSENIVSHGPGKNKDDKKEDKKEVKKEDQKEEMGERNNEALGKKSNNEINKNRINIEYVEYNNEVVELPHKWRTHPRYYGKDSRYCRVCRNTHGLIRKYGLNMCRKCFRERFHLIGFKQTK